MKIIISILLFYSSFCFCQATSRRVNLDSLYLCYENFNHISDKEKFEVLYALSQYETDTNKALKFAKKSLKYGKKLKAPLLQADSYLTISEIHREKGETENSLAASLQALKIFENLNNQAGISIANEKIGICYANLEQYKNALKHLKVSIKNFDSSLSKFSKLIIINNLAEIYRKSGSIDSAIVNFRLAISKNKLTNEDHLRLRSYSYGNLGMIFNEIQKLDSAEKNLKYSIRILEPFLDKYSISIYTSELAKIHQKRKEYKQAEKKYILALNLAMQDGLKEQIRDFNQLLSEFYTEQKDYKKALHHQKQFQIYQDSLVNKDNVRKIEQLKAGYEIDKRETQIGILNQENDARQKRIIYLALGLGSVALLASLLFFSRRKVRKANNILAQQKEEISKREQEKAWLLRELNHRVKNNLQMVASLLNLQSNKLSGHPAQEAIIIGKQRVEALSLVHRKLYQEGVDTRINIKDYITELILGLFHAYNANFKPNISINDNISVNIDSAIPLALIVNEIIINCLKYAYEGMENPSLNIEITSLPEKRLALHIWDNGIGFDENAEMKDSLGMKIINSLTRQLDGNVKHYNDDGAHWQLNVLGK